MSTKRSKEEESNVNDEPEMEEIIECFEKMALLVKDYDSENYKLREENELKTRMENIMKQDYIQLKRENNILKKNHTIVSIKGKGLMEVLQGIGKQTNEEYKNETKKMIEQKEKQFLDEWEKIKEKY
jgi:hypothetical protein